MVGRTSLRATASMRLDMKTKSESLEGGELSDFLGNLSVDDVLGLPLYSNINSNINFRIAIVQ